MKLYLTKPIDIDDQRLFDSFTMLLINSIKSTINSKISIQRYDPMISDLYESKNIEWIGKPNKLSTPYIMNLIVNSIRYEDTEDYRVISIDKHANLPGTNTKLSKVARYLEYGNEVYPSSQLITRVFRDYSENLNELWKWYKDKFSI